ncbi:hypothetical protein GCM10010970_23160 [Silvimonas iriomotensis]|uniref:Uncharacterized protein n=1 Tax=Silvimonas iriomotensis TaxID=449662 RepID=A0ABQ2PAA6_9NEIS|nr:hypothetical protein GCM10010970_23160 [Silvimonas iriomotensis]
MSSDLDLLLKYVSGYQSGIYTKSEAVGSILKLLSTPNFAELWPHIPDWAQSSIWDFLKECNADTVLHDISTYSSGVIDVNLISLKHWLSQMR